MNRRTNAILSGLLFLATATACVYSQGINTDGSQNIDPEGLAILQRVIDARLAQPNVSAELLYEIAGQGKHSFRLHTLGDRLRVDEFETEEFRPDQRIASVIILGEEAWGYRVGGHSDLVKTTRKDVRARGFNAFTPIQIGITTFLDLTDDLENLLYTGADSISVLQTETVNGVEAKKVDVVRGSVTLSHLVDPKSGRIFERRNFVDHAQRSYALSTYESNNEPAWLPNAVQISIGGRSENLTGIRATTTNPAPELFELGSLGIPKGTAVIDHAAQRRIGRWDGTEIQYEEASAP